MHKIILTMPCICAIYVIHYKNVYTKHLHCMLVLAILIEVFTSNTGIIPCIIYSTHFASKLMLDFLLCIVFLRSLIHTHAAVLNCDVGYKMYLQLI